MAMSKKDFELVADVMREGHCQDGSGEDAYVQTALMLIHALAGAFEARYPNFDKEKFLTVAGAK
ncbi:MAG TPA: hypothetical protein VFI41_05255 [Gemmatimonadales bacterium]|nr:hypothetical protein [Gemmatimonadales bacterium]